MQANNINGDCLIDGFLTAYRISACPDGDDRGQLQVPPALSWVETGDNQEGLGDTHEKLFRAPV